MSGSPIEFLLHHRELVLSAFTGSPGEAWKRLVADIQIDTAMKENTFRTIVKPFVEVCQYFEAGLNERLNNEQELNNRLNTLEGLNKKLNNEIERLNNRLNVSDTGLNNTDEKLNNMDAEHGLNKKLNINGWTVAKSGRYFRAFRKIKGRVVGIHLGLTLDGAAGKIKEKAAQITGQ